MSVLYTKVSWTAKQNQDAHQKFKFEYSLRKDDIRRRNHVTHQRCDLEGSSMLVKEYSVRAKQRYYSHNKQVVPIVYGRFQAY